MYFLGYINSTFSIYFYNILWEPQLNSYSYDMIIIVIQNHRPPPGFRSYEPFILPSFSEPNQMEMRDKILNIILGP